MPIIKEIEGRCDNLDTLILVLCNIYIPDYFFKQITKWKEFRKNDFLCFSLVYRNVHLEYFPNYRCLKLSVSITKFLYGANYKVLNANDLNKFCFEINFILKQVFSGLITDIKTSNLTNILEWKLNRLDLVANFTCDSNYEKKIILDIFKQAKYPYLKKQNYDTSIHDQNKSVSLNFYDKNAQLLFENNFEDLFSIENLIRCEVQIKKGGLNSLVKKGHLPGKKLKDIFYNIDILNSIYANYLRNFNLFKKFLTAEQLSDFLLNLKNINEISALECKNMQLTLVDKNKCVSKNTLNKYIKILSKYNVSHITIEEQINLDFSNFVLFKNDQLKRAKNLNLLILIYIYLLHFFIKKIFNRPTIILTANLIRPIKLVEFYNDS